MIISMVGFMATGKTKVGSLLAERLGYKFIDTDQLIVERAGISIPAIFSGYGEKYFRRMETEVLEDLIFENDNLILSTGGGIVISDHNRDLLKKQTIPVLLQASPREISRRVNFKERPLLSGSEERPITKISELLEAREKYYNQFSSKINTDNITPEEVVCQILEILKDKFVEEG